MSIHKGGHPQPESQDLSLYLDIKCYKITCGSLCRYVTQRQIILPKKERKPLKDVRTWSRLIQGTFIQSKAGETYFFHGWHQCILHAAQIAHNHKPQNIRSSYPATDFHAERLFISMVVHSSFTWAGDVALERKDGLVGMAQNWDSGVLDCIPASSPNFLCNLTAN